MRNMILLAAAAAVLALQGCAATPRAALSAMQSSPNALSLAAAAGSGAQSVLIKPGEKLDLALGPESPVLTDGSLKASFQHVTLNLDKPGPVVIEVHAWCDCLGFAKNIFVPRLFAQDVQGAVVELPPSDRALVAPTWTAAASMLNVWSLLEVPEGTHTLLIAADTRLVGGAVGTQGRSTMVAAGNGVYVPMGGGGIAMAVYPYGRYELRIK